jgi:hypothetical protein
MQNMSTAQPAGVPGLEGGIASNGLPQGIDPRAVAADPEGFARNLEGARQQEAIMPGSTFLGQQFARNGPSIGNTFAGAKSAFGPGTNPPSQSSFGFKTNPTSQMPQNLSPVNPMAQQIQAASGGYLSPGNGNRRYTSGLGSLASRRY